MIYYTQLIFVKPGKETVFHAFEEEMIPILSRHRGQLLYRARPAEEHVIETQMGKPYEIHLVAFASKNDYESFRDDQDRQQHIPMKDDAVIRILLIEGLAV